VECYYPIYGSLRSSSADRKIENLAYDLHGVTEEEIAVVEDAVNGG